MLLVLFCRLAGMSWNRRRLHAPLPGDLFVITRIRAELGPPVHDFHGVSPDVMIPRRWGPSARVPRDLSMIALLYWFNRAYRSNPMPVQMEG